MGKRRRNEEKMRQNRKWKAVKKTFATPPPPLLSSPPPPLFLNYKSVPWVVELMLERFFFRKRENAKATTEKKVGSGNPPVRISSTTYMYRATHTVYSGRTSAVAFWQVTNGFSTPPLSHPSPVPPTRGKKVQGEEESWWAFGGHPPLFYLWPPREVKLREFALCPAGWVLDVCGRSRAERHIAENPTFLRL